MVNRKYAYCSVSMGDHNTANFRRAIWVSHVLFNGGLSPWDHVALQDRVALRGLFVGDGRAYRDVGSQLLDGDRMAVWWIEGRGAPQGSCLRDPCRASGLIVLAKHLG